MDTVSVEQLKEYKHEIGRMPTLQDLQRKYNADYHEAKQMLDVLTAFNEGIAFANNGPQNNESTYDMLKKDDVITLDWKNIPEPPEAFYWNGSFNGAETAIKQVTEDRYLITTPGLGAWDNWVTKEALHRANPERVGRLRVFFIFKWVSR